MMTILIIAIIIFVMYIILSNDENSKQNNTHKYNTDDVVRNEVTQINNKNFKVTITIGKPLNSYEADDSIIDVTGQSSKITSNITLIRYALGIPKWPMQYSYAYANINDTSFKQKEFYRIFKESFLNSIYFDLENNINYAFVLLDDLQNEYYNHKNLSKLESQFDILGKCYPDTKSKANSFLIKKTEKENGFELTKEYSNSNDNFYDEYWKLGSKYKTELNLNAEEVVLLNYIYSPNNNFFNIEYCCLEILKLYLNAISVLKSKYLDEQTNLNDQFLLVSDIVARKQFRYRKGSDNYKYAIDSTKRDIFTFILKSCENAVRESYGHKRKLNLDIQYTSTEAKSEFETIIVTKLNELLPALIANIANPDYPTEIELNSQNTTRWKIKFEELTTNYNAKPKEFIDAIINLGKLNKNNPSVENIFFEASKFMAKHDKESSLVLYIHYIYYDLKSATFDNKQHTKTIQKSLFKTDEQFQDFQLIVTNLIENKDLTKALAKVSDIYKVKRKIIQLDRTSIKEVIEQHSETVDLLNEYLKDDLDEEVSVIEFEDANRQEIKIEIPQMNKELYKSSFIDEIKFTEIHMATLELFAKNNFSISQIDFEAFAKAKGVFKNQLIESINDICYDFLDDLLIEEEDDFYIISTDYFQQISIK